VDAEGSAVSGLKNPTVIQSSHDSPIKPPAFALFAYGFRPFFLAAGLCALLGLIAWLWMYTTGVHPMPSQPAQFWHGHEMLYGFIGAAIAGFLLTAVPSWTGARGFAGTPLILLAALWLIGRLGFAAAGVLPLTIVAICDLAFIPALAVLLAPPLLRARNRNSPLLLVLAAIWLTDVVFMYALMRDDVLLARTTLLVAIDIVLLLVTVIGGRIVPAFTASGLRARGLIAELRTSRWVDGVVIAAMIAVAFVDIVAPSHQVAGAVAAVAALAHVWRLIGWRSWRALDEPLVWSLHLAYAWLPAGLAMKALYLSGNAAWAAHWLHALTIGVAAAMILAVMTRAALGHTGRPLLASRVIGGAYVLLSLAAVVRVCAPALAAGAYQWSVMVAGVLWICAFAIFIIVYAPILLRPRIDGRQG
jgi:uncharacterized protein involved in response to NO